MRVLLLTVALVAAASACGGADDAGDTVTPVSASTPPPSGAGSEPPDFTATPLTPAPSPAPSTAQPAPGPSTKPPPSTVDAAVAARPEIQAVVADLAGRLGLDPGAVIVAEAREVTWRDGSLGCPELGVGYTQALVSGTLVVLEAGGTRYEYHSGPQRPLFYCAAPQPPYED